MNYALMLADHVAKGARRAPWAASRCRAPRPAAFGVMAVDDERRITDFVEKPADPPAMPGKPGRVAGQHGHLHLQRRATSTASSSATSADPTRATTSARTSSRGWCATGVAVAHPFELSCVGTQARRRRLLARRRHDRRLLGRQHRPHRHRPAAQPVRHATGRSGPTSRSCRRPSSCTTSDDRRGMAIESLVSGGCIVSRRGVPLGAVLAGARALVLGRQLERCCCPACRSGAMRASRAWSSTAAATSPTAWSSAKTPAADARALLPHRIGHHAGHARHAAQADAERRGAPA